MNTTTSAKLWPLDAAVKKKGGEWNHLKPLEPGVPDGRVVQAGVVQAPAVGHGQMAEVGGVEADAEAEAADARCPEVEKPLAENIWTSTLFKGGAWQTANPFLFPQDMHIIKNDIMKN